MNIKNLLFIKPININMYRYPEISKVKNLCVTKKGRLCVMIEFTDGEIDIIPMLSMNKEWEFCDNLGKKIEVTE